MKTIMMTALTVLSASFAFATTHMSHNYQQVLGDISLHNACVTADTVRSIRPTRTCASELKARVVHQRGDIGSSYLEWYCPKYTYATLEYPRAFERTVCTDLRKVGHGETETLECAAYGHQSEFLPQTIPVQVWEEHGEVSTWPGRTRSFTFPACE